MKIITFPDIQSSKCRTVITFSNILYRHSVRECACLFSMISKTISIRAIPNWNCCQNTAKCRPNFTETYENRMAMRKELMKIWSLLL